MKTNDVVLQTNIPLYVALDHTGSMSTRDAPDDKTRMGYAAERLADLFKRCPREMDVTLIGLGSQRRVLSFHSTGIQARAALMLAQPTDAATLTGDMLEWVLHTLRGQQRATLLIVTDGAPDDTMRYEAYAHWNAALNESRLEIIVLTLGDLDASFIGAHVWRFDQIELLLARTASDRPDGKADTLPPSVAPPSVSPLAAAEQVETPAVNIGELPPKRPSTKGKSK